MIPKLYIYVATIKEYNNAYLWAQGQFLRENETKEGIPLVSQAGDEQNSEWLANPETRRS